MRLPFSYILSLIGVFTPNSPLFSGGEFLWYNGLRKGGRVVDGTGLENQQVNASQVRILSLPPNLKNEAFASIF